MYNWFHKTFELGWFKIGVEDIKQPTLCVSLNVVKRFILGFMFDMDMTSIDFDVSFVVFNINGQLILSRKRYRNMSRRAHEYLWGDTE